MIFRRKELCATITWFLHFIDDFLANGCALQGLIQIVQSAGATVEGDRDRSGERLQYG